MNAPRRTYGVLFGLVAILTLVALKWTGSTASRGSEPVDAAENETAVVLSPVNIQSVQQSIRAVGTLRANESIVIRPEMAGRIRQILFQEGQAVAKDALLIELDDSELQAELSQATAQLKVSRLTCERLKPLDLEGKRYVTKQQLDEVAGSLQVAQANYVLYSTRLAKTKIRAPFEGILGIRRVSPGDFVSTGQDLVNLEDVRTLKIDFKVPETLLRHLAPGQSLELTTDAYLGETFRGTVYVVDSRVDMTTRAVQVRAHIPNVEQRLRSGMFAQVTLHLGQQERAMLIPEEAVIPTKDQAFVYRTQDGTAHRTAVELGTRTRGYVQVLSGLHEEDIIVRVGHHKLQDGAKIRAISPTSPR